MEMRGTTVLCVRRGANVVLAGDGQVTMNNVVLKANARKVRTIYEDKVLAGFAGSTADAFTLFERFEAKLREYRATSPAPQWKWARTGEPTAFSGGSKP